MRKSKPRIVMVAMVLLIAGANAPVATAAVRRALHLARIHSDGYVAEHGRWDVLGYNSPVRAIHAAVLHTGEVWLAAGSGNNVFDFNAGTYKTAVWDPRNGTMEDVPTPWDLFCAGHSFLSDGRLLVAGGTRGYEDLSAGFLPDGNGQRPRKPFKGLRDAYVFDPIAKRYQRVGSMRDGRWYPTLVTLGNGNVLAAAGLNEGGRTVDGTIEVFDPKRRQWYARDDLKRLFPTYPHLALLDDGRLLYSGQDGGYTGDPQPPGIWSLGEGNRFLQLAGVPEEGVGEYGATVLLPPAQRQKFMLLGGGKAGGKVTDPSTNRTAIIDTTLRQPRWMPGPDLPTAKRYVNATILPDRTVLVSGGSRHYRGGDVLEAHLYDPARNAFKEMAEPTVGRNYHSSTLLLPDGSVAALGSNPVKDNFFELRIEVFRPPYFFHGQRPRITAAPDKVTYGQNVTVKVRSGAPISFFSLIRPSAATHQISTDQRLVNVPFTPVDGGYRLTIPENPNVAPAGWYMLFALDEQNRPSVAHWVHLGSKAPRNLVPGSTLVDGTLPPDPDFKGPGRIERGNPEDVAEIDAARGGAAVSPGGQK